MIIVKIAGFDIGGANTDLAVVKFDDEGEICSIKTDFLYFSNVVKKR